MKYYGINCVGEFKTQTVETLPTSGDTARILFAEDRNKLFYSDGEKWRTFNGFGTPVVDFTNGDILYPDHFYLIDTSTAPLSAALSSDVTDGDVVTILDESGSFSSNTFTVASSASNILGISTYECDTSNELVQFIYSDNYGWRINIGGLSTGSATGGGISYLELKPENMLFDDFNDGISANSLWGIIPCVDLSYEENAAFWVTFKAPDGFDYNKSTKAKIIYNNGAETTGNININAKAWIIDEDMDGDSIFESNPDTTLNTIITVEETNKLLEQNILTIYGGETTYPLYFSIYVERDVSENDTYNGPLQIVSLVIYQE